MQTNRRSFLRWAGALSLIPFVGTSLFAKSFQLETESFGAIDMDDHFDPDGWL
jgi:hypothetical protein